MNYALIVGRLLAAPIMNKCKNGSLVINMVIATSDGYKTENHNVVCFRKGSFAQWFKELSVNDEILAEGKISTKQTVKNDNKIYITQILANRIEKL